MATRWILPLSILCVSMNPAAALAGGVPINPGKWEFTTISRVAAIGEPRTDVVTECITEESLDPRHFMQNSQQCSIEKSTVGDGELDATITCQTPMGPTTGEMHFESDGDTAKGGMKISMSVNGQKMDLETSWKGRRVGACD